MGVFVVVYLGSIAFLCSGRRLTIAECRQKGMSASYCEDTAKLNSAETKLWDYTGCKDLHSTRAFFQLFSVVSILVFLLSISLDFRSKDEMAGPPPPQAARDLELGASET